MRKPGESFTQRMERYEREIMDTARRRAIWAKEHGSIPPIKSSALPLRTPGPYVAVRKFPTGPEWSMMMRQNCRCYWCCADLFGKDYHIDHIQPRISGGTDEESNLCMACVRCNLSKNNIPPLDFAIKLLNQPAASSWRTS